MKCLLVLGIACAAIVLLPTAVACEPNSAPIGVSATSAIDTSNYVVVKGGHLYLRGDRVRFWGAIGTFPGRTYRENEETVKRLKSLGFNMIRYWRTPAPYTKGDKSTEDLSDHFLSCCAQEGIRIWFAGLNQIRSPKPEDVSIVNDQVTAEAWQRSVAPPPPAKPIIIDTAQIVESIRQNRTRRNDTTTAITSEDVERAIQRFLARQRGDQSSYSLRFARYWDKRLHALAVKRHKEICDHVNQYTGYRYADDPVFAIWELTNEEWWFWKVKTGSFLQDLPAFFREDLIRQWNAFLHKKYGTDEKLRSAWTNNLLTGESLGKRNVRLLPFYGTVSDMQSVSLGVGISVDSSKLAYSREDFTARRGGDVIEFLLSIWISHKRAEADSLKKRGASTSRAPIVWDTGIGWDLPTQYMQSQADAVSHDSYFNGTFHTDPNHKRFPWMSQLEELPKLSWKDPWLEHNKVEGKPFLVYETQIMQPAKYRAEYPMSIVRTAAIQDWDVICWHYWGAVQPSSDKEPYAKRLDYANRNHLPQGYHFQFDEVQQSAMSAAAEVFKNGLLKPPSNPTTFVFGRRSLYNWEMNGYGRTGEMFVPTMYRYGMRLSIDPSREHDEVIGPRIAGRGVYEPCPIVPTPEIKHDWQKGYLMFDAPGTKMFTGFMANYGERVTFGQGVVLSNVSIHNPEGMPYPVKKDEKYLAFCVASCDGLPLETTKRARISLVSTSFNKGFTVDERVKAEQPFSPFKEWHWSMEALVSEGATPVLVARVAGRVTIPQLANAKYRFLDWHMREIGKGTLKDGVLDIPSSQPIFLIEVTR